MTITDSIPCNFDRTYRFGALNIMPFSETLRIRNRVLSRDAYSVDYIRATFTFDDTLSYSVLDTVIAVYKTRLLPLQKVYKNRDLYIDIDLATGDTVRVVREEDDFLSPDDIFGAGMEKSGTIVRGFTVGTNKDFSLQSGLRLQLSGRLSDDIEVVAALTDESTPIQPEGNTERLDELDKVFIQLQHRNARGTFGDYELRRRSGEFGNVNRKLQGLLGEVMFEDFQGFAAFAGSKGKFSSNTITGLDGVQGPYRLTGENGEVDIIIIAGSEKVFLDGEEMRRGEANDYIIDYSNAEVTFTTNRLILSSSRITVDFEYTDRKFERTLYGAGVGGNLFDGLLRVDMQYFREGDDETAPIDITISEQDEKILEAAGDDRNKAVKSGVTLAEADSQGVRKGTYIQVDTLINNQMTQIYRFAPGDPLAEYNVSFSYVGEGQGDYRKENIGQFEYVGTGAGSYMPIVYLPLPELKQFGNLLFTIQPTEKLTIDFELAGSSFDRNRLSSLDDNDNGGYGRNILLNLEPEEVEIAGISLGKIGLSYKDRYLESRFSSIDRFNEIEFERNYNTGGSEKEDESLREISLRLLPHKNISVFSSAGFLNKGESFSSTRLNNSFTASDRDNYRVFYNIDYVNTDNTAAQSEWLRQKGDAYLTFGIFRPGIDFLAEDREDRRTGADSLLNSSRKYHEAGPYLQLTDLLGMNIRYQYSLRKDFLPFEGVLIEEAKSTGHRFTLDYEELREFRTNLNVTLRTKSFSDTFKEQGSLDIETILIRSRSLFTIGRRAARGDLYYEVSTQKTARLERVFVKVEQGEGNYRYLGDLNNNGIAEENEFELTLYDGDFIIVTIPSEELFPVIDLKTGTRWNLKYAEFFPQNSYWAELLEPLSTETAVRIEENSREKSLEKIYLLDFSSFLNEESTVRGSQFFQQDIFLFEGSQDLSFRLRYNHNRSMNEFSGGKEKGFNAERSIRTRFRMVKEFSIQLDVVNTNDNVSAPVTSNRNQQIEGTEFILDFSYRPVAGIEVGLKLRGGSSLDNFPAVPTEITSNGQAVRFTSSLGGNGRIRVDAERNEFIANNSENYIPFELTRGQSLGKNYIWRLNFDYRLAANLQSTAGYEGRLQGGGRVIHTARAEVRAFF